MICVYTGACQLGGIQHISGDAFARVAFAGNVNGRALSAVQSTRCLIHFFQFLTSCQYFEHSYFIK